MLRGLGWAFLRRFVRRKAIFLILSEDDSGPAILNIVRYLSGLGEGLGDTVSAMRVYARLAAGARSRGSRSRGIEIERSSEIHFM